jgi:predicted dehydrogenase
VYTEKSLTDCLENAEELVKLADAKQLYLGAAPETFLGACFQTAGQAIKDGLIGEVTSFNIYANRDINVLASRSLFLRLPGGGIAFDYGVYYLTALVSLLGPVESVFALKNNRERIRTNIFPESPEYGKQYEYDNETQITAVIRMENSVAGTFGIDGESNQSDMGFFQIYGTKGVLRLGDANCFGEPVLFIPNDAGSGDEGRVLTPVSELVQNCRGIGPAEMAWAIRNGKKCRTAKEMPYHILDIVFQMMKSSETGRMERVSSTCEKPEMLTDPTDILRKEK